MHQDPWNEHAHEVIVCNFGGPESSSEVEPFLRKLFEDPFIIRSHWLPEKFRLFLAKKISKKRAPKSDHEYAKIGYSPINRTTRSTALQLEKLLKEIRPNTRVLVCNRYTAPFATDVVNSLKVKNSRIFMIALYPHICHSTTVSSFRDFDLALRAKYSDRHQITTIRINSWWYFQSFLQYSFQKLKDGIKVSSTQSPHRPLQIIFSAHGIPERYDLRGDPYVNETRANFEALQRMTEHWLKEEKNLSIPKIDWHLSFQSRVGPMTWVGPSTEETIRKLGESSKGSGVLLVPVSFVSDHIETLFEMDVTYKELALASGFASYHRVSPPNDDPAFADILKEILVSHGF